MEGAPALLRSASDWGQHSHHSLAFFICSTPPRGVPKPSSQPTLSTVLRSSSHRDWPTLWPSVFWRFSSLSLAPPSQAQLNHLPVRITYCFPRMAVLFLHKRAYPFLPGTLSLPIYLSFKVPLSQRPPASGSQGVGGVMVCVQEGTAP